MQFNLFTVTLIHFTINPSNLFLNLFWRNRSIEPFILFSFDHQMQSKDKRSLVRRVGSIIIELVSSNICILKTKTRPFVIWLVSFDLSYFHSISHLLVCRTHPTLSTSFVFAPVDLRAVPCAPFHWQVRYFRPLCPLRALMSKEAPNFNLP
jgi:hypothetical protein